LPLHGIEYNLSELADEVKVSRQTISKIMKKYAEWGLLNTRSSGNVTYYSINEESPLVKSIVQFNNVLIETMLGTEKLYEIHDYLIEKQLVHQIARAISSPPEPIDQRSWHVGYPEGSTVHPSIFDELSKSLEVEAKTMGSTYQGIFEEGAT